MATLPARLGERFVLGELIGRGTCSEVYRTHDLLLDRDAAVKIFPVADDPRIEREVALLASLDHPHLVPVYDVGEVDGRAFVVMALFEGSLADRLAEGPMPAAEALLAAAAVADAPGHVHRKGVLHRDVTPRNVLFDADGRAHLSDFGVALVGDAPRITDTGIVVGSAPYLAPEQVRGEEVGAPADVYALGLVLLEALTGRPSYAGTPLQAARARLQHRPEVPSEAGADVGALLEAITADDPAARPTAEHVCVGLRRASLAAETPPFPVPAVLPVASILPPADARGPDPARGLIVVGSLVLSVLLAGTVVFASTRSVQGVSVASTPPSASLVPTAAAPPPAPAVPDPGVGSTGSSDSGSGSGGSDDTDGSDVAGGSGSSGDGIRPVSGGSPAGGPDGSTERPATPPAGSDRPADGGTPPTGTPPTGATTPRSTPSTPPSSAPTSPSQSSQTTPPPTTSGSSDSDDETGDRPRDDSGPDGSEQDGSEQDGSEQDGDERDAGSDDSGRTDRDGDAGPLDPALQAMRPVTGLLDSAGLRSSGG